GRQRHDGLDRRAHRLVRLLPAVHGAGDAGDGAPAARRAVERARSESRARKTMNPHKFGAIAHRDHDYCNPIAAAKIERILDLLPLERDASVLDLGCGRGELSLKLVERFQARVTAVDISSPMLDAVRERAQSCGALERLQLLEIDIGEFKPEAECFDLTVMLGGGGIGGGIRGICAALAGWT